METEHTNIIVWETGIDGWVMMFGVPIGRHDIIEFGGVPFSLLSEENMREGRPFMVSVRASIGEIGKSVVKCERDDNPSPNPTGNRQLVF